MIWLPANSKLNGTWSSLSSRARTADCRSGGAKSSRKPPPPAPISFPPTAPANLASRYISSISELETVALKLRFASHAWCNRAPKAEIFRPEFRMEMLSSTRCIRSDTSRRYPNWKPWRSSSASLPMPGATEHRRRRYSGQNLEWKCFRRRDVSDLIHLVDIRIGNRGAQAPLRFPCLVQQSTEGGDIPARI